MNSNLEEKSGFQVKWFPNTFHTNTQIEEERTCFCTFLERSSCVDTRRTNVRHIWSGRHLVQFLRNFWKTKTDLGKTLYHVYELIMGYLWAKYKGSHFLDLVPPLTRSRKKALLKLLTAPFFSFFLSIKGNLIKPQAVIFDPSCLLFFTSWRWHEEISCITANEDVSMVCLNQAMLGTLIVRFH